MSLLKYVILGLGIGSVYAIISLGYTMVYGIAKMLNFAHGDIIMIGGFVAYTSLSYMGYTDIAGILKDKDDPDSLIPYIDLNDAKSLFEDGTISGGMIPKVECCIEAIHHGVHKVTILDGRVPHALLIETLTDEGAGTMIVRDLGEENVN